MCKPWHAAFAADPSLWPAAVVQGLKGLHAADREKAKFAMASAWAADDVARFKVLSAAADVHLRMQAVRLERFGAQVGLRWRVCLQSRAATAAGGTSQP